MEVATAGTFVTSHAVIYELIEWIAALLVAPELGAAYLGTQGDVWDAQKDMALALAGSVRRDDPLVSLSPSLKQLRGNDDFP